MDISEVGQICVPLISAGRRGRAGCRLEERAERIPSLPACGIPKMGLLFYQGEESPSSPSEQKILPLFRNEVGHVQPKHGEGCGVI